MAAVTKNRNFFNSHLEWRVGLSDIFLKGPHPRTIPARFDLIWFSSFRGKDLNSPTLHSRWLLLLKIEMSSFVHCCFRINQNELKF
jgi:hypothetical protein